VIFVIDVIDVISTFLWL